MEFTAKEIALLVNGTVEGDENVAITSPAKIEEAQEGNISFIANPKYENFAITTKASVLLVGADFDTKTPTNTSLIRVENVYAALAILLDHYQGQSKPSSGIATNAFIHPSATIGSNASIGMFSIIEAGAKVGDNCLIYPQVYIGKDVALGDGVTLYPGVKIYHQCQVGDRCILHANAIIGSDGFGFTPTVEGHFEKIAQIGNVVLESDVEVGSNTVIDRGTMGSTIIRQGVKLDNLIQIAHNVDIGKHTVIAAQTGVAGSTQIGAHCQIGGQVGFVGHIKVADGAKVQAQSGVAAAIKKENTAVYGSPAIGYSEYLRSYAVFKNLPDLMKKVRDLEKRLKDLEQG
ncbi:MAG: UDP-3-O-[3-hydroxymyristoyl] glucosamine N-acyltransferase [Polaribacter sp.]|jgi:UDP-3-O-[3-hydroxymyristoyl] glucosamine N-acyltransferase